MGGTSYWRARIASFQSWTGGRSRRTEGYSDGCKRHALAVTRVQPDRHGFRLADLVDYGRPCRARDLSGGTRRRMRDWMCTKPILPFCIDELTRNAPQAAKVKSASHSRGHAAKTRIMESFAGEDGAVCSSAVCKAFAALSSRWHSKQPGPSRVPADCA